MAMRSRGQPTRGPVFLVGTGRCGSTIVSSILAMHPDFAWVSSWVDSFPRWPSLAVANRVWSLPALDRFRETRLFPKPVEPYDTFRGHVRTFNVESLDETTLREHREHLVPLIERIRRAHGRPRFLGKFVGRPVKVDLFSRLYPDAFFVHVTRGLKPTLSSLLRVDFFSTHWSDVESWPWEPVPPEYLAFYERTGKLPEVGAAIGLILNRRALDGQLGELNPTRRMELPYAEFVADPVRSVCRIGERAGFPVDEQLERRIRARRVYGSADDQWRRHLSDRAVALLDELEALAGY